MEKVAIFCGSFDPFTTGHAHIVERGLKMFDRIVIGVGHNIYKKGWIPIEERVRALNQLYCHQERVIVEAYTCLTGEFAIKHNAQFVLRGLRQVKDYEYELQTADINQSLFGLETVLLYSTPSAVSISSTIVRELAAFGKDITPFLPSGLKYNF